jgi:TetR/AcrR family transcriptional repressor of nem operon
MKYPDDHKAQTRERVLREASKAIRLDGPERMSIAAVMKAAGMTVGGFYAHFQSKDDLIAEAVNFMFLDRYATFFEHIDDPDPREALTRFIDYYLSMRHRNSEGGCPIPTLAGQVPSLPAAAQDRFLIAVERVTGAVADLLEAMRVPDPATTAAHVMAEMIGAVSLSRLTKDEDRARDLLAATLTSVKSRLGLPGSSGASSKAS